MPCTSTDRWLSGNATLPVPIPNSNARPPEASVARNSTVALSKAGSYMSGETRSQVSATGPVKMFCGTTQTGTTGSRSRSIFTPARTLRSAPIARCACHAGAEQWSCPRGEDPIEWLACGCLREVLEPCACWPQ